MSGHRFDRINAERDRNERASRAPGNTFLCGCCGQSKLIFGRRKVGKKWHCGQCVRGAA